MALQTQAVVRSISERQSAETHPELNLVLVTYFATGYFVRVHILYTGEDKPFG